jgi:hypothetical protein
VTRFCSEWNCDAQHQLLHVQAELVGDGAQVRQHHQVPRQAADRGQAQPDPGVPPDHHVAHVQHEEHRRPGELGGRLA